jgi:hypothetical protein
MHHKKDLYADSKGSVNSDGVGVRIASIYQDDDGDYYKKTKDRMYKWDSDDEEWV